MTAPNLALMLVVLLPILFMVGIDTLAAVRTRNYTATIDKNAWCDDFRILVPIYGTLSYLENLDYLRNYIDYQVTLCTTSGESQEFYDELEKIANRYEFTVFISPFKRSSKGARNTGGVIRDTIISDALTNGDIKEKYVVCIDADTRTVSRLERIVGTLKRSGADFASVNLTPQAKGGALVQLQRHEYRQSMRLRSVLPWLLSGACHVAKTSVLRDIMSRHSLFFQGNDVEAGLIGHNLGYKAIYIPFEVATEVPATLKSWWRQRIAWAGGEFRLFVVNFGQIFRHPLLWIYGSVVVILMTLFRWVAFVQLSYLLILAIVLYYAMTLYIHWKTKNWWLALLPMYSLVNSLVIVPIGIITYFKMAIPEDNFGIINAKKRGNSLM